MQNLIATTSEVVHYIALQAVHYKPLQEVHLSRYNQLTRLENVLNNPFTRKRIEYLCGSIEAFLNNPAILRQSSSEPNTTWMRTVSKEEAAKCLKNLTRWAEEDKQREITKPTGAGLGEWIYQDGLIQKEQIEEENHRQMEAVYDLKPSLTPGAMQREWKVPTEFPLCPQGPSSTPLKDYLANLQPGQIYCHNEVYESPVLKAELSVDGQKIAVLCPTNGVTNFALSEITYEDGHYVHTSVRTFFSDEGAEKYYTLSLGKEWTGGEVLEDYC